MNPIELLNLKIITISSPQLRMGLSKIVSHLLSSFRHYNDHSTQDYNDVVYRTNQAFEGILKETYRFLHGKDPDNLKLYEIEDYLRKERGLIATIDTAKQYRTKFRNKSAHDYSQEYSKKEALICLFTVAAIVCNLTDAIIDHIEEEDNNAIREKIAPRILNNYSKSSSVSSSVLLTIEILKEFASYAYLEVTDPDIDEHQLILRFSSFVNLLDMDLKVHHISNLNTDSIMYPSLILRASNGDLVAVDITRKKQTEWQSLLSVRRMKHFFNLSNSKDGVILFVPHRQDFNLLITVLNKVFGEIDGHEILGISDNG